MNPQGLKRQTSLQQALTGLAIVLMIAATLLGGLFLAFRDIERAESAIAEQETTFPLHTATPVPGAATQDAPATPTARSVIPTVIVLPSNTATKTSDAAACPPPDAWLPYVVQEGESLAAIGMRYGLTSEQMVIANCLESDEVAAGDWLAVPPTAPMVSPTPRPTSEMSIASMIPPTPTFTPVTPDATGTQTATDGACTNPDSVISSPGVGANLRGVVAFRGSARLPNFSFFKLEIRPEGTSTSSGFITFVTSTSQVSNDLLGELNTAAFPNGDYWIRLVVVDTTSNYPERCSLFYTIDN